MFASEETLLFEDLLGDLAQLDYLVALVLEGLLDHEVRNAALQVQLCHVGTKSDVRVAVVRLEFPPTDLNQHKNSSNLRGLMHGRRF